MKVAAYQTPLQATYSFDNLGLLRKQIDWCEANDVEILCCPEAVLGGLADYVSQPTDVAINIESGELERLLQPLASDSVTTILGFTEIDENRRLYNTAAVFHKGLVAGVYRKVHPFINKSVYTAGSDAPVFTIGDLTFGIIICLDSNYAEPARTMVRKGASVLFIPTNNGMPEERAVRELVAEARRADKALVTDHNVCIIRADVAGQVDGSVSHGSSAITLTDGHRLESPPLTPNLLVAEVG